jgi:LysM repeat protein
MLKTISELAQEAADQLGWNEEFIKKQWALETGHFTSSVWINDHNPAGIKFYDGMDYGTKGSAASDGGHYAHFDDPVIGYVNFVKKNPRYSNVKNSLDVYTEAKTIAADGWATDPAYADKIMGVVVDGGKTIEVNGQAPQQQQSNQYNQGNAHIIQPGETLSGIAAAYHVSISELASYNSIPNPDLIIAGDTLKIPTSQPPAPVGPPPTPAYNDQNGYHTIQPGETLSGISSHYQVPIDVIARFNNIQNQNLIIAGSNLRIPISIEVRSGDTLTEIARRRNDTVNTIAYVNGIPDPNRIYIGQKLWV